jgi:quercetin dioxygenase-like cupin family protein
VSAFANLDEQTRLRIWDGVSAGAVEGDRLTVAIVDLAPDSVVPEHRHDHEQLGVCVSGGLRFRIGDEQRDVVPGDSWRIGSDIPHEVRAGPDGAVVIEAWAPARDDWQRLERLDPSPFRL